MYFQHPRMSYLIWMDSSTRSRRCTRLSSSFCRSKHWSGLSIYRWYHPMLCQRIDWIYLGYLQRFSLTAKMSQRSSAFSKPEKLMLLRVCILKPLYYTEFKNDYSTQDTSDGDMELLTLSVWHCSNYFVLFFLLTKLFCPVFLLMYCTNTLASIETIQQVNVNILLANFVLRCIKQQVQQPKRLW